MVGPEAATALGRLSRVVMRTARGSRATPIRPGTRSSSPSGRRRKMSRWADGQTLMTAPARAPRSSPIVTGVPPIWCADDLRFHPWLVVKSRADISPRGTMPGSPIYLFPRGVLPEVQTCPEAITWVRASRRLRDIRHRQWPALRVYARGVRAVG